jgi:hypothetical protein
MKKVSIALLLGLAACNANSRPPVAKEEPMQSTMIVGSAETPDPVLARVMALEKAGEVKDVVVQESFPVQIRLRASKKTIDELNAIPRVGGLR